MAGKRYRAARHALREYVEAKGAACGAEERELQASYLITDLLLTFPRETASAILARAERDNYEDRAD